MDPAGPGAAADPAGSGAPPLQVGGPAPCALVLRLGTAGDALTRFLVRVRAGIRREGSARRRGCGGERAAAGGGWTGRWVLGVFLVFSRFRSDPCSIHALNG